MIFVLLAFALTPSLFIMMKTAVVLVARSLPACLSVEFKHHWIDTAFKCFTSKTIYLDDRWFSPCFGCPRS